MHKHFEVSNAVCFGAVGMQCDLFDILESHLKIEV